MKYELPPLGEFLSEHEKNFPSNKKCGLIQPPETTWEQFEESLKRLHAQLSRLDKTQYRAYCDEQHRNWMTLLKHKDVEFAKLRSLGKQREELQGDLHEFREREKFNRRRKDRR